MPSVQQEPQQVILDVTW